jgi:hypothetical protein
MPIAALALLLSTSLAQASADASLPAPPPPPADAAPAPRAHLPSFGIAVDGGAPEGLVLSALWRPAPYLRLWGGPNWNYVALGFHGGATIAPWSWPVAPTLSAEAGRYFSSDLTWLAKDASGVPAAVAPLLKDVGYTYASLQVGVELGDPRGLALSIRAGLSYISLVAHGTATMNASGATPSATDARVELTDPRIRATFPSVKVGLQYWF